MYMLVKMPLVAATAVLAGCASVTSTNTAISNVTQSEQFEKVCRVIPLAKTAFNIITTQVNVKEDIRRKVNTAYTSAVVICRDKPENINEALMTVAELYRTILNTSEAVSTNVATELKNGA